MKKTSIALLAALLMGCSAPLRRGAVPEKFRPLYAELDAELSAAEAAVAAMPDTGGARPLSAPGLYPASSYFTGLAAPGGAGWLRLTAMLDALRAAGAGGVSVMISLPDLTPEARDNAAVLDFYAALAAEVRKRGMKLLVEHFVYPPSGGPQGKFAAAIKASPDPRAAYLGFKRREAELVISRIRPDYFTAVSEPDTCARFLGFSVTADEYADWLRGLLASPAAAAAGSGVKIGAGAGVWEDPAYPRAFAGVKGLAYVDLHFYPLKLGGEDLFARLLADIDAVRAVSPGLPVVISETWLYKHGAAEPKGVFDPEAYGRNPYSFWAPLDARFLALLFDLGRKRGIELISPYFAQYFFYAEDYSPDKPQAGWPASLLPEWRRAGAAASRGELTPLGRAFGRISGGK